MPLRQTFLTLQLWNYLPHSFNKKVFYKVIFITYNLLLRIINIINIKRNYIFLISLVYLVLNLLFQGPKVLIQIALRTKYLELSYLFWLKDYTIFEMKIWFLPLSLFLPLAKVCLLALHLLLAFQESHVMVANTNSSFS